MRRVSALTDFSVKIHRCSNLGGWNIDYSNPLTGKRKRAFHKTKREAQAEKKRLEIEYNRRGKTLFSLLTVFEAMQSHLTAYPESLVRSRRKYLKLFLEQFGGMRVVQIEKEHLRLWLLKIKEDHQLADRTILHIKSQFNIFFKWLYEEGHIITNPMVGMKLLSKVHQAKRRVFFSTEEVMELLSDAKVFCEDFFYPALLLMAQTGARRSEVLGLKRSDIDFSTGLIFFSKTKNGKDRHVRITPEMLNYLKGLLDSHQSEYVFLNKTGAPFTRSAFGRLLAKFKTYFPREKNWGPHSLRHSFAYNFLKSGKNMYQLQAVLGHKNIAITIDLYGQLMAQDIEDPNPYSFSLENI